MQAAELPSRLKLLNWGTNRTVQGPLVVSDATARLLPVTHSQCGFDRIALDYEHNTVPGSPEFERTKEPREVAAYGVPKVIAGEGLFLEQIEWTPSGKANARNYVDLSPAPLLSKTGDVVLIHSVALCRQGAVEDLQFYSVDLPASVEGDANTNNEETMLMDKIMALLRKALGLPDTATEDDIVSGIQACSTAVKDLAALKTQIEPILVLTAPDGKIVTLSTSLDGLLGKIGDVDVKGTIATLSADLLKIRKDLVCYHARLEGKVIPLDAEALAKTDLQTLEGMVAKIAPTVPLAQVTPLNVQQPPPAAGAGVITDLDKEVARKCGVDPAKLK
jgi:phage I-like protein